MDKAVELHHKHMARLQKMGEHWHQKLHYGSGEWDGDRFIFIYHHPLKDEIEVRYEVPNEKPQLVFQIPLAEFDIDKLCRSLAYADNRKKSIFEKIDESDAYNEAQEQARAKVEADRQEELIDKMHHALRRDTGQHIAPMTVPEKPADL